MDSSRAIWRPVTKGLRKQRIVLSPANCCIIHAFLARSGRKPCPAPGLLSPLLLFPSRALPPSLSLLSVRLRKIHFVPVGRLRRAINAAVRRGLPRLRTRETRRPSELETSSFLVPEDRVKNLTERPYTRFIVCAFDVSEKETNSSWGTKSDEFLRKDRLLINTILMFILRIFFTAIVIVSLLVFSTICQLCY